MRYIFSAIAIIIILGVGASGYGVQASSAATHNDPPVVRVTIECDITLQGDELPSILNCEFVER